MDTVTVINGPNLNMLGKRNPAIYGSETLEDLQRMLASAFPHVRFRYFQSNFEGDIIDRIQADGQDPSVTGIIINPGAYAHYSYAIADAIADADRPVVEVHISNILSREEFRRKSVTGAKCDAVITGAGLHGYLLASHHILYLKEKQEDLPF